MHVTYAQVQTSVEGRRSGASSGRHLTIVQNYELKSVGIGPAIWCSDPWITRSRIFRPPYESIDFQFRLQSPVLPVDTSRASHFQRIKRSPSVQSVRITRLLQAHELHDLS
ncbi:hypothetical protein TNCV_860771 [Trichonephila clavipes]|nr:hypothetical protein TNCV_860771 [Trichonephila clavipes]